MVFQWELSAQLTEYTDCDSNDHQHGKGHCHGNGLWPVARAMTMAWQWECPARAKLSCGACLLVDHHMAHTTKEKLNIRKKCKIGPYKVLSS